MVFMKSPQVLVVCSFLALCSCAYFLRVTDSWNRSFLKEGEFSHKSKTFRGVSDMQELCRTFKTPRNRDLNVTGVEFNLNLYPSRDDSKPFLMCAYPKAGCTQWIELLHYLRTGEKLVEGINIHNHRDRYATLITNNSTEVFDRDISTVLITRDPYERTISSYFDFLRRNQNRNVTFVGFLKDYVKAEKIPHNKQALDHRRPISQGCAIRSSGGAAAWDYVLQLEKMSLWLECLLKDLKLMDAVSQGWGDAQSSLFKAQTLTFTEAIFIAMAGGDETLTKARKTGHERTRKADIHTPETIAIVNEIFRDDFVLGGYRIR
jgi:hypothetical protein